MELKEKWNEICADYVASFSEITGLELEFWFANQVGTVGEFGDYFVDMDDIRYVVDNKVDSDLFFEWYDYSQRVYELCEGRKVGIKQYIKEKERPYTEEQLNRINELKNKIEEIKKDLEEEITQIINEHH